MHFLTIEDSVRFTREMCVTHIWTQSNICQLTDNRKKKAQKKDLNPSVLSLVLVVAWIVAQLYYIFFVDQDCELLQFRFTPWKAIV